MTALKNYIAAPPGEIYWRREVCPHRGKNVLLKTNGGICVKGHWYGEYGQYFTAWCPMPKDGDPPPDIRSAPFFDRLKFALKLIFK